ncbi:MAG: hypothetical protein J6M14_03760 [Campylobacter sp.]|nr:hypothetical protein [Campylobacter sp.]
MYWGKILTAFLALGALNLGASETKSDAIKDMNKSSVITNTAPVSEKNASENVTQKATTPQKLKEAMKAYDEAELNFDLLTALELANKDPQSAMKLYEKAFLKTNSQVYLLEALKLAFFLKDSKATAHYLALGDKILADDSEYLRVKVGYYMGQGEILKANTTALHLANLEVNSRNYSILGATYYAMDNFALAKQYFEKAYELEKSEENLIRLSDVLLNRLDSSDAAVRIMETHRRIYGCASGMVCEVLADVYRMQKKYFEVAKLDEALYESKKNTKFLDDMIGIYYYMKEFDKIIEILQKYDYKKDLIMDAYAQKKDFATAMRLAREEFFKTENYDYLANEAIYLYESFGDKKTAAQINEVVAKFENIASKLKDPVHLNYYGYILIDHDLDIKKGIDYVERALKDEPNSVYYIDSLAWGFYKLGECEKAKEWMDKIKDDEFYTSDEGKGHVSAIEKCVIDKNIQKIGEIAGGIKAQK